MLELPPRWLAVSCFGWASLRLFADFLGEGLVLAGIPISFAPF